MKLDLRLPPNATVIGEVFPPDDPARLISGMLRVEYEDHTIDLSWYPEHDPAGRYVLWLVRDSWDRPEAQFETRFHVELGAVMQQWLDRLSAAAA